MKKILWVAVLPLILWSCGTKKEKKETVAQKPQHTVKVPNFNPDSAYAFTAKQVAFGPRTLNSTAHKKTGDYLVQKFKSYGGKVYEQTFDAKGYDGETYYLRNIIASFNPKQKKRIILASHWDTRPIADMDTVDTNKPIDGANDGAAGVGVILEIARVISQNAGPNVGVDMVLFDGEDNGEPEGQRSRGSQIYWCLGSQYWAKHPHVANYSAYYGILLDMVGAKNATFFKEGGSMQFAPTVMNQVWSNAHELGYGRYFIDQPAGGITDDHIFVNRDAKIPMIDIVDCNPALDTYFKAYHHTHADNMDLISKESLDAVGETLLHTLYWEGEDSGS